MAIGPILAEIGKQIAISVGTHLIEDGAEEAKKSIKNIIKPKRKKRKKRRRRR